MVCVQGPCSCLALTVINAHCTSFKKVFVQPDKSVCNFIVKRINSLRIFQKANLSGCTRAELCYNQTYIFIPHQCRRESDGDVKLYNGPRSSRKCSDV